MVQTVQKTIQSKDGFAIHYEVDAVKNAKATLILLHGEGGDILSWYNEHVPLNKKGYTTIILDLRGHGHSGRPEDAAGYDIDKFSDDVLQVVKAEKITKPVLVGHCFGGMVAMYFAAVHPKVPQALILIDTGYKPPAYGKFFADHVFLNKILTLAVEYLPTNFIERKEKHPEKIVFTTDFDIKRIMEGMAYLSLRTYWLICKTIAGFDAKTLLKKIIVPTLVIAGTEDSVFPPEVEEDLRERISSAEIDFIKNGNHVVVNNNPKDVVDTIVRFLEKIL